MIWKSQDCAHQVAVEKAEDDRAKEKVGTKYVLCTHVLYDAYILSLENFSCCVQLIAIPAMSSIQRL